MNSSIDSISARWADYSRITKEDLSNLAAPEKSLPRRPSLEVIEEMILLAEHKITESFLIITRTVSEAETLAKVIEAMSTKIKVKAVLPHHPPLTVSSKESGISVLPFSIFSLLEYRTFPWESFETIIIEQNLLRRTISQLLEINNVKNIILTSERQSLIFAPFQNLVNVKERAERRSIRPLEKFANQEAAKALIDEVEKSLPQRKKITLKSQDATSDDNLQKETASPSPASLEQKPEQSAETEEKHFIAMMPRNFHRQYIRDYIRRFDLKNCLIVAHNRQAARQLENYLYRARIRTKIVHEKLADSAKKGLVERFNQQRINALIVMHRVVTQITPDLNKIDSVFFLDLPSAYVEFAERLTYVKDHFSPEHFISIATENERVWVQSLTDEYIEFALPIVEIEPKQNSNKRGEKAPSSEKRAKTSPEREVKSVDGSEPKEEESKRRRTPRQNRASNSKGQDNRRRQPRKRTQEDNQKPQRSRKPTRRKEERAEPQSQADFFNNEQSDVVNRNRMPFELGSFEANIAQQNRRRMREVFSKQNRQSSGHENSGNFVQNITENNQGNSPNRRRNQSKKRNNRGKR